eukprot:TRINITY_DN113188_c0_g1_i1.p1 TRINITY_DN113188_c0_g1~~TRINITY_DN113188_c0_g1_i1.p1  ORF type:complete len:506 (-),score=53.74 TRINITY_DN113188_c0_g1_i1:185-1615(-)
MAVAREGLEKIRGLLKQFDENRDGTLSRAEASTLFRSLDARWTKRRISRLVDALDTNGDACIDLDELVDWLLPEGSDDDLQPSQSRVPTTSQLTHAKAVITEQLGLQQAAVPKLAPHAPELEGSSHYMLGITIQGMYEALSRIGFPWVEYNDDMCPSYRHLGRDPSMSNEQFDSVRQELQNGLALRYHRGTYVRDQDTLGWIEDDGYKLIAFADGRTERVFVGTGYDLAVCLRGWLKANAREHLSYNEALLAEGSPHVQVGCHIFQSHQQRFPIGTTFKNVRKGMYYNRERLALATGVAELNPTLASLDDKMLLFENHKNMVFHWMDYFVLRQCKNDFQLEQVVNIIRKIGCVQIEADNLLTYTERCFCVFEAFAAVSEKAVILIQTELLPNEMVQELRESPVRTEQAKARRIKDRKRIHELIKSGPGFANIDATIITALVRGAAAGLSKLSQDQAEEDIVELCSSRQLPLLPAAA